MPEDTVKTETELDDHTPKPASEKQIELVEKLVEKGSPEPDKGWKEDRAATSEYLEEQLKNQPKADDTPKPASEKQIELVEKLVEKGSPEPDKGWKEDRAATSEYLEEQLKNQPKADDTPKPASEKQIELVEKLVEKGSPEPDKGWKEDRAATSEYLEEQLKNQPKADDTPKPASEKQIELVEKLVEKGSPEPDKGWKEDRAATSEYLEEQLKNQPKADHTPKPASPRMKP